MISEKDGWMWFSLTFMVFVTVPFVWLVHGFVTSLPTYVQVYVFLDLYALSTYYPHLVLHSNT